jgi:hypothetical protein
VLGHTHNIAACDAVLFSAPEYAGLYKLCNKTIIETYVHFLCLRLFQECVCVGHRPTHVMAGRQGH